MSKLLRYPGSKRFLFPFVKTWIIKNKLEGYNFCEPFCGSASLSFALLEHNLVKKVTLCDFDPIINALWYTVFNDNAWLIKKINTTKITIAEWERIKAYTPTSIKGKAWKCLFLNRTCFSGILTAGPIGGKSQMSNYKIDCRFNRASLSKSLEKLLKYKNRVELLPAQSWEKTISQVQNKECVIYLDPPYYVQGEKLYRYAFNKTQHEQIFINIKRLKGPWILSYDSCPEIIKLCKDHELNYQEVSQLPTIAVANSPKRKSKMELVATSQ